MQSLSSQLAQLSGLIGKKDVSAWEQKFIASVLKQSNDGKDTSRLTEPQIQKVEEVFERHFCRI